MSGGVPEKGRGRRERWLFLFLSALLLVLGVVCFHPLRELIWRTTTFLMDEEGARAWVVSHSPLSELYYIGLSALQVVLSPVPGELTGLLGGLVFGWLPGFLYATVGLTLGSFINISAARAFERVFLERIIPARLLNRFEARVHRWGLVTVFILFLFPGAPKDTMCYFFGLSRIPVWSFLVVSSVARLPGTPLLTLQGAEVFEGDWKFFLVLTGTSMALLVPAMLYRGRLYRKFGITDGGSGEV
ncbi:MAG: VTT domain-containing protein [Thermodesulfobacteriota bacterium]